MHPSRLVALAMTLIPAATAVARPATQPEAATTAPTPLEAAVRERAASVEQKVIAWRRDIHQHPELAD